MLYIPDQHLRATFRPKLLIIWSEHQVTAKVNDHPVGCAGECPTGAYFTLCYQRNARKQECNSRRDARLAHCFDEEGAKAIIESASHISWIVVWGAQSGSVAV